MKKHLLCAAAALLSLGAYAQSALDLTSTTVLFDKALDECLEDLNIKTFHPTLAMCGEYLVVNPGDGSAPAYFNPTTGEKLGTLSLGDIVVDGAITNDNKGNMLITNTSYSPSNFYIYKLSSVDGTPELFISYENASNLTAGSHIHVQGDLNKDAQIVATFDGVAGVTSSNYIIRWFVKDGVVGDSEVIQFEGVDGWGTRFNGNGKVVALSENAADGYMVGHYDGGDVPYYYIDGTTNTAGSSITIGDWGSSAEASDTRKIGDANYMAAIQSGFWPTWGFYPTVHLYDVTSGTFTELGSVGMSNHVDANDYENTGDCLMYVGENAVYVYGVCASHFGLFGLSVSASTGVADITVDNDAEVEYYNLQGIRVANPENGIFIRRQGNKVQKVAIR